MPRPPRIENAPPGQRLLYWLAEAAKQVRIDADASPERVADVLGRDGATIKRFEKAKHWPADADQLVAAYAQVGGLADAREIYQRALDLWYEHGTAPLISAKSDGATRPSGAQGLPELRAQPERLPPLRQGQTKRQAPKTGATTGDQRPRQRRKRA